MARIAAGGLAIKELKKEISFFYLRTSPKKDIAEPVVKSTGQQLLMDDFLEEEIMISTYRRLRQWSPRLDRGRTVVP